MPIRANELERILTNKFGFSPAETRSKDHRWFELQLPDLPTILTKISQGRNEIGKNLEGKIARQLRVRKPFYSEMVGCAKDREDYYLQVSEDPYPPWDVLF